MNLSLINTIDSYNELSLKKVESVLQSEELMDLVKYLLKQELTRKSVDTTPINIGENLSQLEQDLD